ncbi:MAG: sugar kinase [Pseudomonadota bacterium]
MRVAALGEAMIELTMRNGTADVGVAGDTLNTAVYLARSAPSLQVDYVTRLGDEAFSDRIRAFIAAQGVGTGRIEVEPNAMPGLYAITTDAAGERSFSYWRATSAARRVFSDTGFAALEGFDVIYLSGISLAILPAQARDALIDWLHEFRKAGGRVAYDSNHRPALWPDAATARQVNSRLWALCDIALPSLDDEMAIAGEDAGTVTARFVALGKSGALKRGSDGPLCLETGHGTGFPAAPKVVDTTAAGDSFNGGYLAARLTGASQADALRAGHDLAARVVQHRGAILPVGPARTG